MICLKKRNKEGIKKMENQKITREEFPKVRKKQVTKEEAQK